LLDIGSTGGIPNALIVMLVAFTLVLFPVNLVESRADEGGYPVFPEVALAIVEPMVIVIVWQSRFCGG
jgi:hypothetical protein